MKNNFILVADGFAYQSGKEQAGWIFRRIDNPMFGANGYFLTLKEAIRNVMTFGVVVSPQGKVVTAKNIDKILQHNS